MHCWNGSMYVYMFICFIMFICLFLFKLLLTLHERFKEENLATASKIQVQKNYHYDYSLYGIHYCCCKNNNNCRIYKY